MCILSGCDYLPSISGLGVKKAYELLNKYRDMSRVSESRSKLILLVDQDFLPFLCNQVFRYLKADRKYIVPQDYEDGFDRYCCTIFTVLLFD